MREQAFLGGVPEIATCSQIESSMFGEDGVHDK